ncbi:hypothetical protein NC651_005080 [Populus alba x Populus x berolinensis]|nr:hypothetical protein NC651_005080 [Populus alba x Populus x berolinensis]
MSYLSVMQSMALLVPLFEHLLLWYLPICLLHSSLPVHGRFLLQCKAHIRFRSSPVKIFAILKPVHRSLVWHLAGCNIQDFRSGRPEHHTLNIFVYHTYGSSFSIAIMLLLPLAVVHQQPELFVDQFI